MSEAVKNAVGNYGFELPMGRFAACLSLDMSADAAMARIKETFAAEAAARVSAAAHQEKGADVFVMPTASVAPAPETPADQDAFAMPTVAPVPPQGMHALLVRLTYDAYQERDVLMLLDRLRGVAGVEIL